MKKTLTILGLTFFMTSCNLLNSDIDIEKVNVDDSTLVFTYKENGALVTGTVVTYELDPTTNKKIKSSVREVKDGKRIKKGFDYYPSGKVQCEYPIYENGLFTGTVKWFYENGQVQQLSETNKNKLNGITKLFDENGQQSKEVIYENGIETKSYEFDETGNKILPASEKLKVIKIQTGYDPYHNYSNLWLPCVAIKFENNSGQDIKDFIKVTAIFIDNSKKEQIGTQYKYLTTNSEPILNGTTKQIGLASSVGWYAVQNQDVTVKIYIQDELIKSMKVQNQEFDGMLH